MSRRDRKSRGPSPLLVMLDQVAPFIEVAGNLHRAQELGLLGFRGRIPDRIASLVPKSRGGLLEEPDVDSQWVKLVNGVLERDGLTLQELREQIVGSGKRLGNR